MQKTLNPEFLLLSYCSDGFVPLGWVRRPRSGALNMPSHGLQDDALEKVLRSLLERELLCFARKKTDYDLSKSEALKDLSRLLVSTEEKSEEIVVGLSPNGGKQWELVAKPDWALFVDYELPEEIDGRVYLVFRTLSFRMCRIVSQAVACWRSFPPGAHKISTIHDWNPVYWKACPKGYELKVDTTLLVNSEIGKEMIRDPFPSNSSWTTKYSCLSSLWKLSWCNQINVWRESEMR